MTAKFRIPRATDKMLIEVLTKLRDDFKLTLNIFKIIGHPNLPTDTGFLTPFFELIIQKDSANIEQIVLGVPSFTINYYRGGAQTQNSTPSAYYDEIVVNDGGGVDAKTTIEIFSFLNSRLHPINVDNPSDAGISDFSDLNAIHSSFLQRLEAVNLRLTEETHTYRLQLDKEYEEKREILEESFAQKLKNADAELNIRSEKLNKKEEELEKLKADLEDRSNTHERRRIRKELIDIIKENQQKFTLTKETRKMRTPSLIFLFLLAVVSVALTYQTGTIFYKAVESHQTSTIIAAGIRQTLYSFAALGTLLFGFKWANSWHEQHAEAEFKLKQFELDLERASWLVETSLEFQNQKGVSLPVDLQHSLAEGLFISNTKNNKKPIHPVDGVMRTLISSAKGIKLKKGDLELDIDPDKLQTQLDQNGDNR